MKKHKSVVAILLAVMMIFTMMPAMAFAAVEPTEGTSTDYKFSDDLSAIVTSSGVRYVGTVKTWTSSGTVRVAYNPLENGNISDPGIYFEYYDLAQATFLYGNNAIANTYNTFDKGQVTKLRLKKPADVPNPGNLPETKDVEIRTIQSHAAIWTGTVKMTVDGKEATSDVVSAKDAVQNVEITLDQSWSTTNNKRVVNAPAAATTVVNAKKASANSAVFYFDEVSDTAKKLSTAAGADNTVPYDGAEHTIVMKPMEGYSVSYTVFNKKQGTEDPVSAVTLKDVLKEGMTVTATVTDNATAGKTEKVPYTFKGVNVKPAAKPSFDWAEDTDIPYTMADNQKYDPYDYIVVKAGADTKEAKAAAKANEELLKSFFKDYFGVTATPNAVKREDGCTVVKLAVGDYSVKKAEDVDAKYAAMLADFGIVDPVTQKFTVPANGETLVLVPADEFFEIEFINSPTSKTYKAKVLKKKAKSFKVKAEATNGDAVVYKLINAPEKIKINKKTGKITLKKGLKKGTYKITVKAYVPKSYSWSQSYPCEYHSIKIKVKK